MQCPGWSVCSHRGMVTYPNVKYRQAGSGDNKLLWYVLDVEMFYQPHYDTIPAWVKCCTRGAKQAPSNGRSTACLCNAAHMRQRMRFISFSLSRSLTSLPAAVMFCHTFRPLCDAVAADFLFRFFFFFGDVSGAPRERDFLFLYLAGKTGETSIFRKKIYRGEAKSWRQQWGKRTLLSISL